MTRTSAEVQLIISHFAKDATISLRVLDMICVSAQSPIQERVRTYADRLHLTHTFSLSVSGEEMERAPNIDTLVLQQHWEML